MERRARRPASLAVLAKIVAGQPRGRTRPSRGPDNARGWNDLSADERKPWYELRKRKNAQEDARRAADDLPALGTLMEYRGASFSSKTRGSLKTGAIGLVTEVRRKRDTSNPLGSALVTFASGVRLLYRPHLKGAKRTLRPASTGAQAGPFDLVHRLVRARVDIQQSPLHKAPPVPKGTRGTVDDYDDLDALYVVDFGNPYGHVLCDASEIAEVVPTRRPRPRKG